MSVHNITPRHDKVTSPGEAHTFFKQANIELDKLLIGEREAKLGILVTMATGGNVVFVGEPGGGKTTLAEDSYRLISGIDPEKVVTVPPLSDLRPEALVGGKKALDKFVEGSKERTEVWIEGLMKSDTQVVFLDEVNRVAPHALNSLLGAIETGRLHNTAGEIAMASLEFVTATMNPGRSSQNVFGINPAYASRHAVGVVLGHNEKEAAETVGAILDGWTPEPLELKPAIDLEELNAIRNLIGRYDISENLNKQAYEWIVNSTKELKKHHILESPNRFAKQVGTNSRAIAALHGEPLVDEEHVKTAIRFVVGARIGMLATQAEIVLPETMDKIFRGETA